MEKWQEYLVDLRILSENVTQLDRLRQKQKVTNEVMRLANSIITLTEKITANPNMRRNIKKRLCLIDEWTMMYDENLLNSPLNVIKREMDVLSILYESLKRIRKELLIEYFE